MSKILRIAVFHELDFGGALKGVQEFSRALKKLGHTIDLFYVSDEKDETRGCYNTKTHYRFFPVKWNGSNWKAKLYRDTVELHLLKRLHQKIASEIDSRNYDVAFVHPSRFSQAPFILRFLHAPTLYYCQEPLRLVYDPVHAKLPKNLSLVRTMYERMSRMYRKQIDIRNLSSSSAIVANSRYTQQEIFEAYGLKAETCYLGVDSSIFYPEGEKKYDALFIGTREEIEGFGLLKQAVLLLRRKPTLCYLIRGENWVKNQNVLRKIYSSAKIVLCLGYNEPFGLTPIEAMACGTVPVALREGGYLESIRDKKTGLLVRRDPKELASTINMLLSDPHLLRTLSERAIKEVANKWSWMIAARKLEKTLARISRKDV